jgi:hypothetical protein
MNASVQRFSALSSIVLAIALWSASPWFAKGAVIGGPSPSGQETTNEQKGDWGKSNSDVITAWGTAAAALFALIATLQTLMAAARSEKAARAQRLADLFEDINKLDYLTPQDEKQVKDRSGLAIEEITPQDETVGRKIVSYANTMEKIAFCWKNKLVDEKAVVEELGGGDYVGVYDQIKCQPRILWLNRSGEEVVKDMPTATMLRNHLDGIKSKNKK